MKIVNGCCMPKFVTNQNIEIDLELGSLGERILAFFIDMLIISCLTIVALYIIGEFNLEGWLILVFLIPLMFYSLLFEFFGNGQSPGKRAMNIKVVKMDGTTPTIGSYLLRWLFRILDIYLMYGSVSVVSIIVTKNGQRLGDLVAGTIVIKVRQAGTAAELESVAKDDHVVQFPAVKSLTDEQIELMKKALDMRKKGFNKEGVTKLAEKLKEKLKIETDLPDVKFLYTIIADYEHLANQEF